MIAYIVSLAVLLLATQFTVGLTADSVPIQCLNALVAATSTMDSYEITFKMLK